ncbi:MAG: hypothetical protein U0894_00640 [Pirellulales bacterium]
MKLASGVTVISNGTVILAPEQPQSQTAPLSFAMARSNMPALPLVLLRFRLTLPRSTPSAARSSPA